MQWLTAEAGERERGLGLDLRPFGLPVLDRLVAGADTQRGSLALSPFRKWGCDLGEVVCLGILWAQIMSSL